MHNASQQFAEHGLVVATMDLRALADVIQGVDDRVATAIDKHALLPHEFEAYRQWLHAAAPAVRGALAQPVTTFATLLDEFHDLCEGLSDDALTNLSVTLARVADAHEEHLQSVLDTYGPLLALKYLDADEVITELRQQKLAWGELGAQLRESDRETWRRICDASCVLRWRQLAESARKLFILRVVA